MSPKLIKSLLLAAALGCFLLWIMEVLRTDLGNSYWLLMLSLTLLLAHQYYRLRTQPEAPKKQSTPAQSRQTSLRPTKRKKKK
ncbi:hypothetical protein [Persicitalea sp.]|uniref:hypothetical protein n=1 Tax=Persicitalea sp. TaxID=3100273 RepID=UPI003593D48C